MAELQLVRSSLQYPKLIYYNKLDKGGHFAAWEQPEIFSTELRAAFQPLHQSI
jgi:pimeloyl-ACP methyl ester carboxylesterase